MGLITGFLATTAGKWALGGLITAAGGPLLKWLLKKLPTEKWKEKFGNLAYKLGRVVTLFLGGKFKYTKPIWNSVLEPWVIVFLESAIVHGLSEFVRGLRSDNQDD